jgi:carbon monoxide dehydrogenase subunit G
VAIEVKETLTVQAPIARVWAFFMDPYKVAACMPGAELKEVVDDSTFLGGVNVKVGAITTSYSGKVAFTNVDETAHSIEMVAEGTETGGGTAKGTMSSRLMATDAGTEIVVEASIDLTGRIMQVGRGMIQGVSHQLFQQFSACVTERLEAPEDADETAFEHNADQPINIVVVVVKTVWAAISGFFRRLFGGGRDAG